MKLLLLLGLLPCAAFAAEPWQFHTNVPLPGVKGRFDHFAVDVNTHCVFVAALGNNTLEVIDAAAAKRLHTITGLHKPTGVAFLADANRLVVANGDDGTVKIFDGTSYELIKSIDGLDDADNVRYDGKARLLYVGYGDGALGIIDSQKLAQIGSIKLKAHPESFQLEQDGSRIFVNVPDAKHIAIVDREKRRVVATWSMEEFQANFPMALDELNRRLFIGCRKPARLVVFDAQTGKPVTNLAISGDTDDLFYDVPRKRLYISCGEGSIDVVEQTSTAAWKRVVRVPTSAGARTSFFSPSLNLFFLAVPVRGERPAELEIFRP
jgi:WD40 repeat protein